MCSSGPAGHWNVRNFRWQLFKEIFTMNTSESLNPYRLGEVVFKVCRCEAARFNFHVLQRLPLEFRNGSSVVWASQWWSINKNGIENWYSLDLVMIIESACVLILWMNVTWVLPNALMLTIERGLIDKFWAHTSMMPFMYMSCWVLFSDLTCPHTISLKC